MEFTLPPGELDRIFVETKKGARGAPPVPAPEPRIMMSPNPRKSKCSTPRRRTPVEVIARPDSGSRAERLRGAGRGAPRNALGHRVPDERIADRTAGPASPATHLALRLGAAGAERLSAQVAQRRDCRGCAARLQVIHHNREWLAAHTPLGAPLRAIYSTMGTPVTPPANLSAYQLRQWGVTGDPAGAGSLRVRASILNTAAQLEPYPLLRVTLANRFGGSIGTRDFEPSEYLGKPTAKLLAPGERVDATLDILDPGKSAEGFEIDVCLRSADRRVACANDKAPAQAKR